VNWQSGRPLRRSRRVGGRGAGTETVTSPRYVEDKGLPFFVLVDETREVMKRYGVWHRSGSTRGTSRGRRCS
jgi:peroxiredoxin